MEPEKRKKEFIEGYDAGKRDLLDKDCVKQFTEGYKTGYKDGYQAAMEDMKKKMMMSMSPEMRQKMMDEGGAQPQWPAWW